jgi:transposase
VSRGGYPLAYDIFEGNAFEGHTLLPVIDTFKKKYALENLVVVADADLLSNQNIRLLQQAGYEYILGDRIKSESQPIKEKIWALSLQNGQSAIIQKDPHIQLIISHSAAGAKKGAHNRARGIAKQNNKLKPVNSPRPASTTVATINFYK